MSGWKKRLDKLPVLFHYVTSRMTLRNNECIDGDLKHAHFIGTREYVPAVGVKYAVSVSGAQKGREQILKELIEELGQPEITDQQDKDRWMYMWPSESQEIPNTRVHETLGEARIGEIMDEFKLSEKERQIIKVSLALFAYTMGMDWEKRWRILQLGLVEADPDRLTAITKALLQINQEFAKREAEKKQEKNQHVH